MHGIAQHRPQAALHRTAWRMPAVATLVGMVATWHERARSRRLLLTLDDRGLRDIGIDRTGAELESNLPFWRRR